MKIITLYILIFISSIVALAFLMDYHNTKTDLKYIIPDNFGAYPNDLIDDTEAFKLCIDYAKEHKIPCIRMRGIYIVNGKCEKRLHSIIPNQL